MGEVYRARDTRLQRTVALKILPAALASGAGARERFEREAKAISALSHPHICALYDVGRHDGLDYLVLEFLEGETLADRLARGPLPVEQTLRFGAQIASALGAAHRHGIVHRDLKPGNVMLTRTGVKLLDFGLAKPVAPPSSPGGAGDTQAATRTGLTQEGIVPGTVPYMAPEQIEGGAVDARTDIFALGAVLYEMTTGRRAFEGKTSASLMAAILERDPAPIATLRPLAPEGLDHLVRVCLAKRPEDRWQSADDISRELAWIARPGREPSSVPAARVPRVRGAVAAIALLAAGALAGWLAGRIGGAASPGTGRATDRSVQRLSIVLPDAALLAPAAATPFGYLRPSFAISSDDSLIAYVSAATDGTTRIVLRRGDRYEPEAIAGTEGGFDPFFSPDGRWLGFFTFDALRKVAIDGGVPLTIAAVVNPVGGTWCDDGTVYVGGEEGRTLWRVSAAGSAAGGKAEPVELDDAALSAYPRCLPGSRGLLLTMAVPVDDSRAGEPMRFRHPLTADVMSIGVLDLPLDGRRPRPLIPRAYAPQYASGRIIFARSGTLLAAPFDLERRSVTGPETAAIGGVSMCSIAIPAAQYELTPAGSLFFVPGVDQGRTRIVWVDRQGRFTPTAAAPDLFGSLSLSAEGRRMAVEVGGLQNDVYVYDLATGRRTRITSDGRSGRRSMWHPDARRVVFYSEADHRWVIRQAEGDTAPEPLSIEGYFTSWSPPGTLAGERDGHIWLGTRERQAVITSSGAEWGARISPDGRFVAYTSARTGVFFVYVQPIPATGQEWQVSVDFGEEPVWSRDSRELFYRKHDQWWSVPFTRGTPGAAQPLFRGPFLNALGPSYDVAPDGRFLMALPPAPAAVRELRWIRRWSDAPGIGVPPSR